MQVDSFPSLKSLMSYSDGLDQDQETIWAWEHVVGGRVEMICHDVMMCLWWKHMMSQCRCKSLNCTMQYHVLPWSLTDISTNLILICTVPMYPWIKRHTYNLYTFDGVSLLQWWSCDSRRPGSEADAMASWWHDPRRGTPALAKKSKSEKESQFETCFSQRLSMFQCFHSSLFDFKRSFQYWSVLCVCWRLVTLTSVCMDQTGICGWKDLARGLLTDSSSDLNPCFVKFQPIHIYVAIYQCVSRFFWACLLACSMHECPVAFCCQAMSNDQTDCYDL